MAPAKIEVKMFNKELFKKIFKKDMICNYFFYEVNVVYIILFINIKFPEIAQKEK